jgi:hypothetical protein
MGKYIILKAESMSAPGWEERRLSHTEAFTSILAEHYDRTIRNSQFAIRNSQFAIAEVIVN